MAETPQFPETEADQPVPDPAVETSQPDLTPSEIPAPTDEVAALQGEEQPLPEPLAEAPAESEPDPVAMANPQPPWEATAEPESVASAPAEAVVVPEPQTVTEPEPEPEAEAVSPPESALPPAAAPEPEPAGVPIEPAVLLEGVAATITVHPRSTSADGEGGEWELLLSKLQAWLDGARFQERWDALGGPLRALGLLLAAVVVLRLYGALLDTLGDLPLLPRLLQLVGLVSLTRFSLTRLVRSSERERILTSWRQRWDDFRGRS